MGCSTCGQTPCNCTPANCCPDDACQDPGLLEVGRHLPILDYRFCERRLENVEGFLVCQLNGSGTAEIFFTNEPCIVPKILEVGMGDPFCGVASFLGDAGCLRTVKPEVGVSGWLKADGNGCFVLAELPSDEGVPDPLQINNLIVNETATITNLVIGETLCFDALPEGDIITNVGLNAENCLVQGAAVGISGALFYESADLLSDLEPNFGKADNESPVIGNEIYDPSNIAAVLNDTTIKVLQPGEYLIWWCGCFMPQTTSTAPYNVALDLKINGSIVANGNGRSQAIAGVDVARNARVTGMHLVTMVADDTVQLEIGKGSPSTGTVDLRDVKVVLVLFKPA